MANSLPLTVKTGKNSTFLIQIYIMRKNVWERNNSKILKLKKNSHVSLYVYKLLL